MSYLAGTSTPRLLFLPRLIEYDVFQLCVTRSHALSYTAHSQTGAYKVLGRIRSGSIAYFLPRCSLCQHCSDMTDYDIYANQLFTLNRGYALYEPDPAAQYDHVRVGDVGHVMYGAFHRLFNVFLPAEDPVNQLLGVPEYFEPLPSKDRRTFTRTPTSPGVLCSSSVSSGGVALQVSG